jgi:two-component system NtrC family sensor kinase
LDMRRPFKNEANNYALFGALFGVVFPVIATVMDSLHVFGAINISTVIQAQSSNPLLWIIDSAPVWLGLFAWFGGSRQDKVNSHAALLEEIETRYRIITENVTDVIWTMDMDLNFTYISPSTERLIGYTPEEEMAIGLAGIITPDSLEVASKAYEKGLGGERKTDQRKPFGSITAEMDHIHKDGHIVPTDVRMTFLRDSEGRPIGILGVTRDMSKRKEMEQELLRSEESHRLVVESLNDGVIVVDVETMTVVFSNRRGARLCGFDSVDDFVGVGTLNLVHPDDSELIARAFVEDLYEGRRQRYELRLTGRDGEERWVSVLATRMEFQGRVAVLCSVKDITELKRAEEEKRKMEQQVQLSGRLASVGELAAGVAHELNNPIAAVQGFAQLLAGREDLEESVRSDIESILREARRASRITSNLLSFARKHKPEKDLISINEVVEKSVELHAYRMKVNNIDIVTELDSGLPQIMADFYQMQQVFVNIITNAEQAMSDTHGKGTLTIRTGRRDDVVQIALADTGPGIAEENLPKIFDPFFTTKEVGKGTGLGLGICHGIVEQHGGRIYAASVVGEGTTFTVELPITGSDAATGGQTASERVRQQ